MDSILSTILSAFTHNPIFVLAIIAYIVFSFLKSSKTEDADEYENSGAEKTWEDMEREYGISIERKIEEPAVDNASNSSLAERLEEFKHQKAMERGKMPLVDIETHTKPVTKKVRKSRHDIKEGMKWAFILEKPKALRHRTR